MKSAGEREPDGDEPGIWLTRFREACLRIALIRDVVSLKVGERFLAPTAMKMEVNLEIEAG